MFEKIKKHLLFIKDIIIDTVAYWATLGLVYVYTRFALVPEINADIQLAILLLISFVIYWVYKKNDSVHQKLAHSRTTFLFMWRLHFRLCTR